MSLDIIREKKENALKAMQQASSSAVETVDDGMHAASHAAISSVGYLKVSTERAIVEGQVRNSTSRLQLLTY